MECKFTVPGLRADLQDCVTRGQLQGFKWDSPPFWGEWKISLRTVSPAEIFCFLYYPRLGNLSWKMTVGTHRNPREFQNLEFDYACSQLTGYGSSLGTAAQIIAELETGEDELVVSLSVHDKLKFPGKLDLAGPLHAIIQRHATGLNDPATCDVRFTFGHGNREAGLYASSAILKQYEYFHTLLSSDYAESVSSHSPDTQSEEITPDLVDEKISSTNFIQDQLEDGALPGDISELNDCPDDDSDGNGEFLSADMNEFKPRESGATSVSQSRSFVTVNVSDFAFRTYYATVYYLYTGNIRFAPLQSTYAMALASNETASSRLTYCADHAVPNNYDVEIKAPPASPKAIYRLADKLLLLDLKNLAMERYLAALTPQIAICEFTCSLVNQHEELKAEIAKYMSKHWPQVARSEAMHASLRDGLKDSALLEIVARNLGEGVWVVPPE